MIRDTEAAFHWITGILDQKGIPYKLLGGFAARLYGVDRELADIDIEVADKDVFLVAEETKQYAKFGPARYLDENWDLDLLTLEYEGQEIDIASAAAHIFNQATKRWELLGSEPRESSRVLEVFGKKVRVESPESLITYKTKLGREVDLEDARQLQSIIS